MTQEDMKIFTPVHPEMERRANDSLVVLLMKQVYEKIEAMDQKLSEHMTNETLVLAEEIAKLMHSAFPQDDPYGHRIYHESQMQAIADKAAFWKSMRIEIAKYGLIGLLGWLIYIAWIAFLKGPK